MIEIREEHPADIAAVRDVNAHAFGQNLEGNIVDAPALVHAFVTSQTLTKPEHIRQELSAPIHYLSRLGSAADPRGRPISEWPELDISKGGT